MQYNYNHLTVQNDTNGAVTVYTSRAPSRVRGYVSTTVPEVRSVVWLTVADQGFPRGRQPKRGGVNLLFGHIFLETA